MAITVFTDGSSRGNPGPGGWAAFVIANNAKVVELGGRDDHTTNNRMELTAAIESLRTIRERGFEGDIEIHSDSAYVLNGITKWVYGWEKNNWLTKEGEPVLNQDLWSALLEIARQLKLSHDIIWKKVEGHSGLAGNERVDEIATGFADKKLVLLFSGTYKDYLKMLGSDIFHVAGPKEKKGSKKSSSAKAYSYVSLVSGVIHTDSTWAACEKRVKGKKGARYKKALSAADEAAIIKEFSK
jgi:ribonuclease HI